MNIDDRISIIMSTEEIIYLRGFLRHQLRKLSQCEERDQVERFLHRLEDELMRSKYEPKNEIF